MLHVTAQHIVLVSTICAVFIIGVYVLLRKPRDVINQSFFLFVAGVTLWVIGFLLLSVTGNFIFNRVILYGGLLLPYGLFLFSKTFPTKEPFGRKTVFFSMPFLLGILIIIPSRLIIDHTTIYESGQLEPTNGPLFPLYAAIIAWYVLLSLFNFIRHYRHSSGKARMRYLSFGLSIFVGSAFIFDALLPAGGITFLNILGPLSSFAFVGFTAYAIVRHQLLDIRVVIQRGIIYTVLLTFIVVLYFALIGIFGYALEQITDAAVILAALITSVVGIFSTPVIDQYLRRVTDRFFFKDRYDYSEALYELSKILNTNIDFETIKEKTAQTLGDILRASSVAIDFNPYAIEVYQDAETGSEGIVVPIEYEGVVKGSVIVGAKLSGDPFTNQDWALVRTFSEQASIALEKARLFKEVEDYSLELENKVVERTAKIQKLQKDQESMIMDISHGLQNPLVLAKIEVDSMKKTMPQNKTLDIFEHAIDNISSFIYRLMHLTKLERDDEKEKRKKISLSALLKELVEYFEILTREKHIALTHAIEPDIMIMGKKERLEELITNIVSNAVKYNIRDIKDKKIHIELRRENDGANLVVEDTGVGIDPEELSYIFDRFYQSKKNNASSVKSHGLGLSIARRITELHGGTIAVESELGRGTRVEIFFPDAA